MVNNSMNIDHQRLLAAIEALEGEGYSVVPTKATIEVMDAGLEEHYPPDDCDPRDVAERMWDAMLAKAADKLKQGCVSIN